MLQVGFHQPANASLVFADIGDITRSHSLNAWKPSAWTENNSDVWSE
jgi:hypothetical protein